MFLWMMIGKGILAVLLLWKSSDHLLKVLTRLSLKFQIRKEILGVTILAVGTSLPEVIVSVLANQQGYVQIALGNVFGSNVVNSLLAIGIWLFAHRVVTLDEQKWRSFYRLHQWYFVIFFIYMLQLLDFSYSRWDAIFYTLVYIFFVLYISKHPKAFPLMVEELEDSEEGSHHTLTGKSAFWGIVLSFLVLHSGARLGLNSAYDAIEYFQWGESFVGSTLVAVGTSLPELFIAVASIHQGEIIFLMANVIGSNIFNVNIILAMVGILKPYEVTTQVYPLYAATILAGIFLWGLLWTHQIRKPRWWGFFALLLYGLISYGLFVFN